MDRWKIRLIAAGVMMLLCGQCCVGVGDVASIYPSMAGDVVLFIATNVALWWLEQMERFRHRLHVAFLTYCMAAATLWYGVDAKWHIIVASVPRAELRGYTPWACIFLDAVTMYLAVAAALLTAAIREHVEPMVFVKPGDRPRPRASPYV